jgi:hypothetical protein
MHVYMLPEPARPVNNNSMVLVHERTIPTELLPLVGEISANFCG